MAPATSAEEQDFAALRAAADGGDVEAMLELAERVRTGKVPWVDGHDPAYHDRSYWLRRAEAAGNEKSMRTALRLALSMLAWSTGTSSESFPPALRGHRLGAARELAFRRIAIGSRPSHHSGELADA